jgi:hypothetical protein
VYRAMLGSTCGIQHDSLHQTNASHSYSACTRGHGGHPETVNPTQAARELAL